MMKVEVVTPEDFAGDVIGDLNVEEVKLDRLNLEVTQLPLMQLFRINMFGYINNLRSSTKAEPNIQCT